MEDEVLLMAKRMHK